MIFNCGWKLDDVSKDYKKLVNIYTTLFPGLFDYIPLRSFRELLIDLRLHHDSYFVRPITKKKT